MSIRPILKRLHSPDISDLGNPAINEDEPFCILLQAMFGPAGAEGEESFDILVCNPKWAEQRVKERAFFGRHYLFVASFDIHDIRALLEDHANLCAGSTWQEVAVKLGSVGHWEFEGYKSP